MRRMATFFSTTGLSGFRKFSTNTRTGANLVSYTRIHHEYPEVTILQPIIFQLTSVHHHPVVLDPVQVAWSCCKQTQPVGRADLVCVTPMSCSLLAAGESTQNVARKGICKLLRWLNAWFYVRYVYRYAVYPLN